MVIESVSLSPWVDGIGVGGRKKGEIRSAHVKARWRFSAPAPTRFQSFPPLAQIVPHSPPQS